MFKMVEKNGLALPGGTKKIALCREKQVGEKSNTLSPGCCREENQNKELKEMKVAVGLMRKKMGSMLVALIPVMLALLILICTPGFAQGAELKQDVDKKTVQVVLRDYVLKYRSVVDDLRKELEGISDAGQGPGRDDELNNPKESLKEETLGIGFPEQPAVGVDPSKGGSVMSGSDDNDSSARDKAANFLDLVAKGWNFSSGLYEGMAVSSGTAAAVCTFAAPCQPAAPLLGITAAGAAFHSYTSGKVSGLLKTLADVVRGDNDDGNGEDENNNNTTITITITITITTITITTITITTITITTTITTMRKRRMKKKRMKVKTKMKTKITTIIRKMKTKMRKKPIKIPTAPLTTLTVIWAPGAATVKALNEKV